MQFLKQISSSLIKSPISSLFSQHTKPLAFCPLIRPFSVSNPSSLFLTQSMEQKKERKLPAHMYGGGENGGVDYGWEVMDKHRKGPHKKVRPNRNPLGFGIPFAKGIVIKPVVKKPKKPNSANRKVTNYSDLYMSDIKTKPAYP